MTRRPGLLVLEQNSEPQPHCAVCRTTNIALKIDVHHTTLKFVIDNILIASAASGGFGMSEEVSIVEGERYAYMLRQAVTAMFPNFLCVLDCFTTSSLMTM